MGIINKAPKGLIQRHLFFSKRIKEKEEVDTSGQRAWVKCIMACPDNGILCYGRF